MCEQTIGVSNQRVQLRLLKEGEDVPLIIENRKKSENVGCKLKSGPNQTPSWDQRFQELVDFKKIYGHELVNFKKIHGHANVLTTYGGLGRWVSKQRRLLKEGEDSPLTIEKRKKLENIGCELKGKQPPSWDQRFQELVDFKKIYGHANVATTSRGLGRWVSKQRRLLKEGEDDSPLIIEKRKKLDNIGFNLKS
eukprot:scaffold157481_cov33-Attheya_sp.AAC.1